MRCGNCGSTNINYGLGKGKQVVTPDNEILGVEVNHTLEELKTAYKSKAKLCHPDVGGSDSEFVKLSDAYERLLTVFDTYNANNLTIDEIQIKLDKLAEYEKMWQTYYGNRS